MTRQKDKYKVSLMSKLEKIIQQNNYIITLLEHAVDDSQLVTDLQNRFASQSKALRHLEYENFFLKRENTRENGKSDA